MVNSRWCLFALAILGLPAGGCVRALDQAVDYACKADSDCPPGNTCFQYEEYGTDGICGVKGVACVSSEDCTRPAFCRRAVLSGAPRSALGQCELLPVGAECVVDEDCLTGDECVPQTSRCTERQRACEQDADCVEGQFCALSINDRCASIHCSADTECFPYACGESRECSLSCWGPSDCAPGAVCRERKCQAE